MNAAPSAGAGSMSAPEVLRLAEELASVRLELAQMQRELAQVRAGQEDLLYAVVHDLRAPLRHVISFVEVVREDLHASNAVLDPQIYSSLDRVSEAARHQGRLIDALLELSRIGRAPLQLSAVALGPLVAGVLAPLRSAVSASQVRWDIADGLPTLRSDPALLCAVLQQLFDNALKFTAPRQMALIKLRAQVDPDGGCELQVSDNGVGFDARPEHKLFQPFSRMHSATEFAGLGMGLVRCRAMLQRLGASIELQARPDQGCTVSVQLPRL